MGVSKIVREIEGKWVDGLGWVMGKLGEKVGLSGVRGLVNWGVFGKWMGMGGEVWWEWVEGRVRGEWWLICWITNTLLLREQWVFVGNIPLL